jgi:hypothetical protein
MTITYSKQVLLKRGNTAAVSTYTGPLGELVLNTDTMTINVQDGVTAGGGTIIGNGSGSGVTDRLTSNGYSAILGTTGTFTIPGNVTAPGGTLTHNANGTNLYISAGAAYGSLTVGGTTVIQGGLGDPGTGGSGQVQIQAGSDTESGVYKHTWAFDGSGQLTLPVTYANGGVVQSLSGLTFRNIDEYHGETASLIIPPNGSTDPIRLLNTYGNIQLNSGVNSDITAIWNFNADGKITFPDNTVQTTAYPGAGDVHTWVNKLSYPVNSSINPIAVTSTEYDSQGNIIALVLNYSNGPDFVTVMKFDQYGSLIGQVNYADTFNIDGWGLAVDLNDDSIYITGSTAGVLDTEIFITKLTSELVAVWTNTYGTPQDDNGYVIDVASDGNPVIVGISSVTAITILKVASADGAVIWQQELIAATGSSQAYGMGVGPSGEIVAVGNRYDVGDSTNRQLVVKYDSTGAIQWQKELLMDAGFECRGADADIDSSGNIYVLGTYDWASGTGLSVTQLNSSGVAQWTRKVQGPCNELASSIVCGQDGFLYLEATSGTAITGPDIRLDKLIAKYDTSGAVIWQRKFSSAVNWQVDFNFFTNGIAGGSLLAVRNGLFAVGGLQTPPYFGGGPSQWNGLVFQTATSGVEVTMGEYTFAASNLSGILTTPFNTADAGLVTQTGNLSQFNTYAITLSSGSVTSTHTGTENLGNFIFFKDTVRVDNGMTVITNRGTLNIGTNMEMPGVPQHFHIAFDGSNGTAPTSDLFLGDDWNYTKIPAGRNGVIIGAGNLGGNAQQWNFGIDGNLTLPNSATISDLKGGATAFSSIGGVQINTAAGTWQFGGDGELTLPVNVAGDSVIYSEAGNVELYTNHAGSALVSIRAKGASGDNSWVFNDDGSLTLPGGGTITSALGSPQQGLWLGWNGHKLLLNDDGQFWTGGVQLGGSGHPGYVGSYGNITLDTNIGATPGDSKWVFGTDGNLTLPSTNTITAALTAGVGTILTGIESYLGAGAPYGYVWNNVSSPNFVNLYGMGSSIIGWTFYTTSTPGSTVTITGLDPLGSWSLAFSGDPGVGPYTAQSPNYLPSHSNPVVIGTNSNNWTFGTDGSLTLPGAIITTANTSSYTSTTVTVDITALVNKLVPQATTGAPHYYIPPGTDGQIMYLVPANIHNDGSESTTISFDNARWSSGAGPIYISEGARPSWLPFAAGSAVVTIIFANGAWNLPY